MEFGGGGGGNGDSGGGNGDSGDTGGGDITILTTSNINVTNIDTAYPVAGQDNDSQGFRDNFTNINQNFIEAKNEIEALQNAEIIAASPPAAATGASGDIKGTMAYDTIYMYLCTADFTTGVSPIWIRAALTTW